MVDITTVATSVGAAGVLWKILGWFGQRSVEHLLNEKMKEVEAKHAKDVRRLEAELRDMEEFRKQLSDHQFETRKQAATQLNHSMRAAVWKLKNIASGREHPGCDPEYGDGVRNQRTREFVAAAKDADGERHAFIGCLGRYRIYLLPSDIEPFHTLIALLQDAIQDLAACAEEDLLNWHALFENRYQRDHDDKIIDAAEVVTAVLRRLVGTEMYERMQSERSSAAGVRALPVVGEPKALPEKAGQ